MSGASSGGSWCGAPDIIDLDRYMRGARDCVPPPHRDRARARLVVDAGGAGGVPEPPASLKPASLSSKSSAPRGKRYSHDSGLSDGSDVFERRRHRRAVSESVSGRSRSQDERGARAGPGGCSQAHARRSSDSLRNFKVVFERALKEQQKQLAHVAQLCERLTSGEVVAKRGGGGGGGSRAPLSNDNESSDLSSSGSGSSRSRSRSTHAKSKRDRHRSAECKTYKIIMTKLDELNRVFLTRRPPNPPAPSASPPAPAPPPPAAHAPLSEVSVSDKVVATDLPSHQHSYHADNYVAYALTSSGYHPAMYRTPPQPAPTPGGRLAVGAGRMSCTSQTVSRLVTTRAHELDIAPATPATPATHATPARAATPVAVKRSGFINVVTENVVAGCAGCAGRAGGGGGCSEAEGSDRSAHAPHCPFDLDDPVHSKRLPCGGVCGGTCGGQVPGSPSRSPCRSPRAPHPVPKDVHACDSDKSNVHKSLCSVCKGYWRALAGLASHYFYRPEDT